MPDRLTQDVLLADYRSYGAPRERWLVGGEYERAVVRPDGRPVDYHDADGIRWIVEQLSERTGWKKKYEGDYPVECAGDGASITLEPGGQVELSGAPFRRLADLSDEVRKNRAMLYDIARGRDLRWISCGLTPYARIADIRFVPKGRYDVMREYLPQHGELAHWMMKGTCSVQANFDYADEEDCARKFHVALALGPLNTAIFANSPVAEGRPTGFASYRGYVWTRTDPARTGFPAAVRAGYTHARWVDYLLDTPMMFYRPGGTWAPAHGVTFRQWMDRGIDGVYPTADDWTLHQTSVFPEVRVKRTIEIRGADAVNIDLSVAFCALWTGLLYGALDEATALADRFAATAGTPEERHLAGARAGLSASYGDHAAVDWARELVAVAEKGLRAIGEDTAHLAPLAERVASGRSPAVDTIEAWERDPSPANILKVVAY
ncbi:MAG: glutamate--cysteine ligase [Myxococcota bacterium]